MLLRKLTLGNFMTVDTESKAALPSRVSWFSVGLVLIIFIGLLPRLASYQFGLPYVEWHDEAHLYWFGQCARGLYDPAYCRGYPPGYLAASVASQLFNEAISRPGLAPSVETLRLLGVLLSAVGIYAVGESARLIAGKTAGLISAGLWAVSTPSIEYALYAIPESITIPLTSLILMFALMAWLSPSRWRWAVVSIGIGVIAALFDYRIAVFILPGVFVLLRNALGAFLKDWKGWLILSVMLGIVLVALTGLIYLFVPASRALLLNALGTRLWNIDGLLRTIVQAHEVTVLLPAAVIYSLGLLSLILLWRRKKLQHVETLFLCAGLALLVCIIGFTIDWDITQPSARIQNVLPASAIFCILLGASASFVFSIVFSMASPAPYRYGAMFVLVGIVVSLILPQALQSLNQVTDRRRESSHVLLRHWVEDNLETGTIIVSDANHKTFNPFWGGIPHRRWFDWWITEDFTEYSIEEWRRRGMSYMAIPLYMRNKIAQDPAGTTMLNQMLPLVEFTSSMGLRGPDVAIYRLWRMEHELQVRFGSEIELIGYDSDLEALPSGSVGRIRLYWQGLQAPSIDYSLFIHILPMDAVQTVAQIDGSPARLMRPTYTWTNVNEIIISDLFEIQIPTDLSPGQYRILIGLYDYQTMQRLPITDNESLTDAFQLATFTVPE